MGVNHFILVVSTGRVRGLAALDVLEARISEGRWPLNRTTPNRNAVRGGDNLLLYVAQNSGGASAGCFVGSAIAVSGAQESRRQLSTSREWLGGVVPTRISLPFRLEQRFHVPVRAAPLVPQLGFIKDPRWWGLWFQRGIVRIGPDDFATIIESGEIGGDSV